MYCTLCTVSVQICSRAVLKKLSEMKQKPSSRCVNENQSFVYLHLCQGGGLRQTPSWSSAPSSLHSDSGSVSSGPGSRRGHRGHHRGNHPQREKDRSDLGGEEKRRTPGGKTGMKGKDRECEVKREEGCERESELITSGNNYCNTISLDCIV